MRMTARSAYAPWSNGGRARASGVLPVLLAGIGSVGGCDALDRIHVCDHVTPADTQVNERGDQNESVSHPQGAADTGGGRIVVAFVAQSREVDPSGAPLQSQVRVAVLDANTGSNIALCDGIDRDEDITASGVYAYAASVTRAPFSIAGRQSAALVSWTQGTGANREIRMRFIDPAGCPMGDTDFAPRAAFGAVASVSWSERAQAVLATINDERSVYAGLINDVGPAPFTLVATSIGGAQSYAASAVAADGTAFVAWNDLALGPRGALLDPSAAVIQGGDGLGIDLGFPVMSYQASGSSTVAVIGGTNGFAVVQDGSLDEQSAPSVYMRQFDLAGTPLGATRRVSPGNGQDAVAPSGVFLDDAMLAVAWQSRANQGTVGGLYGLDSTTKFNTIRCDEAIFPVGQRGTLLINTQSALLVNEGLWVFYTGQRDAVGTGVGLWRIPVAQLWPGPL